MSGYDEIYLSLIPKLTQCNFKESARRLGLEYTDKNEVKANFLNREYVISLNGAEPLDGKPVGVNNRSVLLYYLLSQGSGEPDYSFVPLNRLTGTIAGRNNLTTGIMNAPLITKFGNDMGGFKAVIETLGGIYRGYYGSGGHAWIISLLPKIPAKVIFYEADEEFSADIQIMFDETAPKFMDFECLAFLCGCFVGALINAI